MPEPSTPQSSRRLTRETGHFTRTTPGSQSLERGLRLLRVFRPGVATLTNSQLANRTGLSRPTVSRLTRSLVDAGFLIYEVQEGGYRLSPVTLSLSLAFRHSMGILDVALPFMRKVADGQNVNVGIAMADELDMVYLESVRKNQRNVFRHIVPGSRIPMALTSLGRAYLSGLDEATRALQMARLSELHGRDWPVIEKSIRKAVKDVRQFGYCHAMWNPGLVAVAAPMQVAGEKPYAINISVPRSDEIPSVVAHRNGVSLLELIDQIKRKNEEIGG